MSEPLRQIARNAGEEAAVVYNRVIEGKGDFGFNAASGQFEDLVKAGVIDPAKVVRSALENAVSAASMMLTTEAAIAEAPRKAAPAPTMPPGGGMGGMPGMGGWAAWVVWAAWGNGWHGRYGRYGQRIYRRRGFLVRLQLPRPAVRNRQWIVQGNLELEQVEI